jgi:4'-phosphopantetheinyl transferase
MLEICAVKIPKTMNTGLFESLLREVDEERKIKISKFVYKEDAYRTLIGDVLIRSMICEKLKVNNKQLSFYTNEYGKPFINNTINIHFNVSHAAEWVLCAISNAEIGIDIELIQPIDLDIAKYYFSDIEYMDLLKKRDAEKIPYFFDLWTLKESYIKARGMGLSIPLKDFCIRIANEGIIFSGKEINKNWFFKQYEFDKLYKVSVCSGINKFPRHIKTITVEDIKMNLLKSTC